MSLQFDPDEPWDNLHSSSRPDVHWSTDNVGEAAPGVLSPLGASIWSHLGETTTRAAFVAIGVLARHELALPQRPQDKVVAVFCGRLALQVELLTTMGDRLPGTSGHEIARSLLGAVPDDIDYRPTVRRYPVIAGKLSRTFLSMPARLRREPPRFQRWWRRSIDQVGFADLAGARHILADGLRHFESALRLQSTAVTGHTQVMYEALRSVVRTAGVGDMAVLSGTGGAELAMLGDIWLASRGELTREDVLREHGFHGPLEGEVSSTVWREDPTPIERIISEYDHRDDPRQRKHQLRAQLPDEQASVLAALPRRSRPAATLILRMAATGLPLRGVAKRSYLQGIDVIRASARRIGEHLAHTAVLADPEDAFYLTTPELLDLPVDTRELVARRRERREQYRRVSIPAAWKGQPAPVPIQALTQPGADQRDRIVHGIGAGPGVAMGVARNVTDRESAAAEIKPGEVVVAPAADPSWAAVMFVAAALVTDIGGPLSHVAVIARELGLPCVVNTRTGTRTIKTGDHVRVDGRNGVVDIMNRPQV